MRVPALADVGVASMINGPEGFTPDNEFCLGETEVAGFFVAAGFCAHGIAGAGGIGDVMANWVLDGDPGLDLWHMDVRRFGRHYRSPGYTLARVRENYESYYDIRYPGARAGGGSAAADVTRLRLARRARGELRGEGRVGAGEPLRDAGDEALRPRGWAGRHWSPCVEPEHRAVRETRGAVRRDVVRQDRDQRAGRGGVLRARLRRARRPAARRGRLHAGAERARRHRDGRDGVAAGRRRVPRRHGHGVRAARPRLAAPSGPSDAAPTCASPT